jgi:uncharacterized phage protein (TIGR01671 family)
MREIKFRAWNTADKSMHFPDWKELAVRAGLAEMKLMQFTGLKDKNGKEIFEGDIIFNKGILVGEVKFGIYKCNDESNQDRQKYHMGWYVHILGDRKYVFEHFESLEWQFYNLQENLSVIKREDQNWVEVKGNKFENPELNDVVEKEGEQ